MGPNQSPVFTRVPVCAVAQISAANTNRDGTGTIGTIYTATADGARIDGIRVKAIVTTTAGMIRIYINDGSGIKLWKEFVVTAITVAAGVAGYEYFLDLTQTPLLLKSGDILLASTHNAETFNVFAHGGQF